MAKNICFITPEIMPFCETSTTAKFSRKITAKFHAKEDIEIRLFQPKYGFISERKYILREVIRLKDLTIEFDDKPRLTNIKSAFIPETRVQVYFVQDDDFFKTLPELIYKAKNGRVYKDNSEKFAFFSKVTIEGLKKLYWKPDYIFCNDWQTSFIPSLLNKKKSEDEFYKDMKSVFIIHSIDDYRNYSSNSYRAIGLEPSDDNDIQDNLKLAMNNADIILLIDNEKDELINKLNNEKELKEIFDSKNNDIIKITSDAKGRDWREATVAIENSLKKFE
jgi:starch synthase